MKRSEVNALLKDAAAFLQKMQFRLPPFAYWSRADWQNKDSRYDEIRDTMLGWDITDFGSGDYNKIGLLLFTLRNGSFADPRFGKPYAEKLMLSDENQVTPFHYHYKKMEDIINRGGGNLMVQLYNRTETDGFADTPVQVSIDGFANTYPAGTILRLTPGESITLPVGLYHSFWAEEGHGRVMLGEVSMVNDDKADNHFYDAGGRFPDIEEDEEPLYLLSTDYSAI
jgi:D-lyxose ketol-isomerase